MSLLLLVFFFFKQKTAYEMRISDWSSDVCSSDLKSHGFAALADRGDHAGNHHLGFATAVAPLREHPFEFAQIDAGQDIELAAPRVERMAAAIGRASWRERVCQYV